MLGHGSDDGDVPREEHEIKNTTCLKKWISLLGVASVPEGVETSSPRGDPSRVGESNNCTHTTDTKDDDAIEEKIVELF